MALGWRDPDSRCRQSHGDHHPGKIPRRPLARAASAGLGLLGQPGRPAGAAVGPARVAGTGARRRLQPHRGTGSGPRAAVSRRAVRMAGRGRAARDRALPAGRRTDGADLGRATGPDPRVLLVAILCLRCLDDDPADTGRGTGTGRNRGRARREIQHRAHGRRPVAVAERFARTGHHPGSGRPAARQPAGAADRSEQRRRQHIRGAGPQPPHPRGRARHPGQRRRQLSLGLHDGLHWRARPQHRPRGPAGVSPVSGRRRLCRAQCRPGGPAGP